MVHIQEKKLSLEVDLQIAQILKLPESNYWNSKVKYLEPINQDNKMSYKVCYLLSWEKMPSLWKIRLRFSAFEILVVQILVVLGHSFTTAIPRKSTASPGYIHATSFLHHPLFYPTPHGTPCAHLWTLHLTTPLGVCTLWMVHAQKDTWAVGLRKFGKLPGTFSIRISKSLSIHIVV